jgi:hypothetical protein
LDLGLGTADLAALDAGGQTARKVTKGN